MRKPDLSKKKFVKETRWRRVYALEEPRHFYHESKFADGSAHITLEELAAEWPHWRQGERIDFCQEVGRATFSHLPDVVRFIMRNGDRENVVRNCADDGASSASRRNDPVSFESLP